MGASAFGRPRYLRFRLRSIAVATAKAAAAIACALLFFACSKKDGKIETSFAIPDNALPVEESVNSENQNSKNSAKSGSDPWASLTPSEKAAAAANEATSPKSSDKIDYDLTNMNANMVYSQVFNMMIDSEMYNDKVIKMKGAFAKFENQMIGGTSYAVIISDAMACCQQGVEFHYDFGDKALPQEGAEITVTGVYVTAMLKGDIAYNYVQASAVEY